MKHFLIAFVTCLLLPYGSAMAGVREQIAAMNDPKASYDMRLGAEDALLKAESISVLRALAPVLPGWPEGGIYNSGGREYDRKLPFEWQRFYSVYRVWDEHLAGPPNPEKGKLLLDLVRSHPSMIRKTGVLAALMKHRVPESVLYLTTIVNDAVIAPEARLAIVLELMEASAPSYFATGLSLIEQIDRKARAHYLIALLEVAQGTKDTLSPASSTSAIALSCKVLKQDADHDAYDLALALQHFASAPAFAPDKTLPQYHSARGPNQAFYDDTVKRALAWCAQHTPAKE